MKKIMYYDPFIEKSDAVKGGVRSKSLLDLVKNSDIITVHIPAKKNTLGIFDRDLFPDFKEGSFFINTSRAELVDEDAMLGCLESGKLAGAAIDVFNGEFEVNHDELLKKSRILEYAKHHDNLLITPHIGGSTIDAWKLTERRTINLILEAVNNKKVTI